MDNRALPGGEGREDIPHNGDPASPASVMGDSGCQALGFDYVITTLQVDPMVLATLPAEDRPSQAGDSCRSYGAADANGGRENSGWQTQIGSLLLWIGWFASRRDVARFGPGHGRKKSR